MADGHISSMLHAESLLNKLGKCVLILWWCIVFSDYVLTNALASSQFVLNTSGKAVIHMLLFICLVISSHVAGSRQLVPWPSLTKFRTRSLCNLWIYVISNNGQWKAMSNAELLSISWLIFTKVIDHQIIADKISVPRSPCEINSVMKLEFTNIPYLALMTCSHHS